MVPLSPSLPSSPAPPRPLLGHPPRSGIHYVCAVPPGGARRAHDDAATAGAVAGAALQLSRRRERQRQRQRQRQRECMLVGALVGRWRPLTQRFRRFARVCAVGCLYACCLGCLEPDCGCAQLQHVLTHLPLCRWTWRCAMLGPLWPWSLGDSLRLWCWAGWSCRRKPHGKCLKYAQSMHFRALRAPWTKYITTSRGRGRKLHFSSGIEAEKSFRRPGPKTKRVGRSSMPI